MGFLKKVPEWKATGTEPSDSLKASGFVGGYKPPASIFNWFWHGISEAVKEIQAVENLETYTSLSQIGLKQGSETIQSIVESLPEYSTLFMNVGTDNANIYPVAYGALYVMKRDNTRTYFEFLEKTSARRYFGVYDSTMSTPWSEWERFSAASELNSHLNNKENPHGVTKEQVGLGNVPNVTTNNQTPTYSDTSVLATLSSGEKLNVAFQKIKCAISNLITHIGSHKLQTYVSYADIGLTIGSETIEGIATNLPDNSQLFVVVGADGADIYPVAYGVLYVYKKNTSRTFFEFMEKTSARKYYGVYDSTMSNPWTGWGRIYSEHNKPTPADIGALALTGGTLTGQLNANSGIVSGNTIRSGNALANNLGTSNIPWNVLFAKTVSFRGNDSGAACGDLNVVTVGTASTIGETRLTLGNVTPSGSDNNSCGRLRMYGTGAGYTGIIPGNNTDNNYTLTLPSKNGTVALTSDIPLVEDANYPGCYYRTVNGKKEWINPPMVEENGYLTTERHNGQPVYVWSCEVGYFSSGTTPKFYSSIPIDAQIVSVEGIVLEAQASNRIKVMNLNGSDSINVTLDNTDETAGGYAVVKLGNGSTYQCSANITIKYIVN